ncbi:hypothetical protein PILCRDRAFT_812994 [Piloderma croceum F 1598]|uniref:Uncharacterized protein n=1 Tax=Piloderma croceum (strain F 1598) TaxID=765440 RepID=A0A0C3CH82_PILCF|nr:hypothetical protein PILCRDRAFT_812994 [Piloderma croceum F 1598]
MDMKEYYVRIIVIKFVLLMLNPIESLITYVQEKGIERGRFINKEYRTPSYQAPPGMVIAGRTCVRGLGIQDL